MDRARFAPTRRNLEPGRKPRATASLVPPSPGPFNKGETVRIVVTAALVLTTTGLSADPGLDEAVTEPNVFAHVQALAEIGKVHGNRAVGTAGYEASAQYVERMPARPATR